MTIELLVLGQELDGLGEDVALLLQEQVGQDVRNDVVQVLDDPRHRQDVKQEKGNLED